MPEPKSSLPENGTQVTAKTFESVEYDTEPEEVTGVLQTKPSPFGGLPQCWVGGRQVDPRTVQAAGAAPSLEE